MQEQAVRSPLIQEMIALLLLTVEDAEVSDRVAVLYRKYRSILYTVALGLLQNKEDAEDAVSDAFESLIKMRKSLPESDEEAKALLVVLTRRRATDIIRKKTVRSQMQFDEALHFPEDTTSEDEILALAEAVAKLPEDLRSALMKHIVEGYTTAEIAEMEGIKQDSVQKRIKKARELLRKLLEEEL